MTLTIDCKHFTATPMGEGKMRLEIIEPSEQINKGRIFEAKSAIDRLSQLLSRPVSRKNLAYWRTNLGLPHRKLGPKKFTYKEEELKKWAEGQTTNIL